MVPDNLGWWWRRCGCGSCEGPDWADGFAPLIYLINTPVVRSVARHLAGIECCKSLVAYKHRWVEPVEIYIM